MNTSVLQEKFNGKYKLTWQREIIFRTISNYTDQHPSAEDVYKIIHRQHPDIGLATVYRTLELLSSLGIVQKLDFGDGRHRYEINDCHALHHHHFICISCGKVIEMKEIWVNTFHAGRNDVNGISVTDYQLYAYGYCKDCEKNQSPPPC